MRLAVGELLMISLGSIDRFLMCEMVWAGGRGRGPDPDPERLCEGLTGGFGADDDGVTGAGAGAEAVLMGGRS